MAEAQEALDLILETNREFRQLASQHHSLDERLLALEGKQHLTDAEQLEEITLKKKKLLVKDQMETLRRQHAGATAHA